MPFNCQIKLRHFLLHAYSYGDTVCAIPPILNLPILFSTSFGAKPPNLMTTNVPAIWK